MICSSDRGIGALHAVCEEGTAHIVKFVVQHRTILRLRHDRDSLPELVRCDVGGGMRRI
jgi:hypothetical protein